MCRFVRLARTIGSLVGLRTPKNYLTLMSWAKQVREQAAEFGYKTIQKFILKL